ncbi:MAG TPA: hypothetical protein VFU37_06595 [Pyrinomonadaceae bacterium]|nr:hypothetical protein [Pyrinomonadaceae bacterium]
MTRIHEVFNREHYAICRSCIKQPDLTLLYRYACKRAQSGTMTTDARSPGAWAAPGDVFMDGLLVDLLPFAESVTGLRLFPTYSYFRVYRRGDVLVKHTDRPACEITLTLCLGYQAQSPWPLLLESPGGVLSIELEPGDGLFYRGTEWTHWREPMNGDLAAQAFLHYVDRDGPYAEWKYDKRQGIPFDHPRG